MQNAKTAGNLESKAKQVGIQPRPAAPPANEGQLEGAEVDKIRNILFGSQMRDYDTRFSNLEGRIARELEDFRKEADRRFGSLETYIKTEVNSVVERLTAEQQDRAEAVKNLLKALKEASETLEKRMAQLHDQFNKGERDLRAQLLDQSKSLADEIRSKRDEIAQTLEDTTRELRAIKVDRSSLASMLTDMVMRLTGKDAMDLAADPKRIGDE